MPIWRRSSESIRAERTIERAEPIADPGATTAGSFDRPTGPIELPLQCSRRCRNRLIAARTHAYK